MPKSFREQAMQSASALVRNYLRILALTLTSASLKKLSMYTLIGLSVIWMAGQYWPVTVHINGTTPDENFSIRMPFRDKKRLEYFFRDVCFLHEWAYTLMGSKPVSTYDYVKPWAAVRRVILHSNIKDILLQTFFPPRFHLICYLLNPEQLKLKLGWDTLNKYIQQFPNSRFVLFSRLNSGDRIGLFLLDKIKIINLVKLHLPDFREKLDALSIEPEELSNNDKLYSFIFNLNNDFLIGSVLGFGRDNAYLYDKYRTMDLDDWPLASPWPDEEALNLEKLNQKDTTFQPWDLSDLFYPQFACDPESEETKRLKQTYRQEREEIVKYYEGKDVVEATLSLFNQK